MVRHATTSERSLSFHKGHPKNIYLTRDGLWVMVVADEWSLTSTTSSLHDESVSLWNHKSSASFPPTQHLRNHKYNFFEGRQIIYRHFMAGPVDLTMHVYTIYFRKWWWHVLWWEEAFWLLFLHRIVYESFEFRVGSRASTSVFGNKSLLICGQLFRETLIIAEKYGTRCV